MSQLQNEVHGKNDDFESVCQPRSGQSPAPEHILNVSRARGQGGKMAQKGVFAMCWSFATGSEKPADRIVGIREELGGCFAYR